MRERERGREMDRDRDRGRGGQAGRKGERKCLVCLKETYSLLSKSICKWLIWGLDDAA